MPEAGAVFPLWWLTPPRAEPPDRLTCSPDFTLTARSSSFNSHSAPLVPRSACSAALLALRSRWQSHHKSALHTNQLGSHWCTRRRIQTVISNPLHSGPCQQRSPAAVCFLGRLFPTPQQVRRVCARGTAPQRGQSAPLAQPHAKPKGRRAGRLASPGRSTGGHRRCGVGLRGVPAGRKGEPGGDGGARMWRSVAAKLPAALAAPCLSCRLACLAAAAWTAPATPSRLDRSAAAVALSYASRGRGPKGISFETPSETTQRPREVGTRVRPGGVGIVTPRARAGAWALFRHLGVL